MSSVRTNVTFNKGGDDKRRKKKKEEKSSKGNDGEAEKKVLEAARSGDHDRLKSLLKASKKEAAVEARDSGDLTALMLSARNGNVKCMRLLIEAGADVDAASKEDGRTALIAAARRERVEALKLLLRRGARPNKADRDGYTALMEVVGARFNGDDNAVAALVDSGADVNLANDK